MSIVYQIEKELEFIESIFYNEGIVLSFNKHFIAEKAYEKVKKTLNLDTGEKEDTLFEGLQESDPSFIVQGFFNTLDDIGYYHITGEKLQNAIKTCKLTDRYMIEEVNGILSQLYWDEDQRMFTL